MNRQYFFFFFLLFSFTTFQAQAQDRLGVAGVVYPLATGCATPGVQDSVVVRISNVGAQDETNFSISYSINGGIPVTETVPLLKAGLTTDYKFSTLYTRSVGVNDFKIFTSHPGDNVRSNDTGRVRLTARINTFPYLETFENNDGGYLPSGTNSSWGWGTPNKTLMKPGQGTKSWFNGFGTGDGFYRASDASILTFPCFDFSKTDYPLISFKLFIEVENGWESVTMEYSTNGSTFQTLGTPNEPNSCNTQNWFNSGNTWTGNVGPHSSCGSWGGGCPGGNCGKWVTVRHCVDFLKGQPVVYFRLRFASTGTQCQAEGVGLDSVYVGEAAPPPFSFNASSACINAPVAFTPTLHPCITSIKWNFGDNTPVITTPNAFHAYSAPGTYNAMLIATSYCGKQDTFTKAITILPPPAVTQVPGGLDAKYCATSGPVTLAGTRTPTGGSYFIDGVAATTFDPSALTLGMHKVVYVYTEPTGNRCTNRDTQIVEVYLPDARIDSLGGSYCISSPAFTLKGSPAGGSFTVDGTASTTFDAALLGLGQHIVVYTYTDASGCTGTDTRVVDVVSNIVAGITGLSSTYCKYEPALTLIGTPTGGTFTIDGVITPVLDPQQLSAGTHQVIYSYSDGGSCGDKDTAIVEIIDIQASINNLDTVYCPTSGNKTLQGTPAGGTFYINNNIATILNPTTLPVNVKHEVMYIYIDPVTLCTDTAKQFVRIDKPVLKFTGIDDSYCKNTDPVTLNATPAGGTFKLNTNTVTQIDPTTLDTGNYTLTYTYTNPLTGCSNSLSKNIYIAPLPTAAFIGLDPVYCITADLVVLDANPSGGAFSIDNLPVQMLDPSLLSVGQLHTVSYQYVEQNYGCMVTITQDVNVVTPPSVSISGLRSSYCVSDSPFVPTGNPAGGTFKVNDVAVAVPISPAVLGAGTYKFTYAYTAANGCDGSVNQTVEILPMPAGAIVPGPEVSICKGEEVTLTFTGTVDITWNTGDKTKTIVVSPPSTTDYWISADACKAFYDSVKVVVKPLPVADFTVTPEEGLLPLDVVAQANNATTSLVWIVDTNTTRAGINPLEYSFITAGDHIIQLVVDSNGCKDTLERTVKVVEKVIPIKMPNVFTPDKDGINDDFGMNKDARRFVREVTFQVFNRWGNEIYTTSDPYQRWDGTDKGSDAPDGVYFYVLNAKLSDDTQYKLTGSVTLIRGN